MTVQDVNPNILLVEDDLRLSALIQEYLQQQGLTVTLIHRGDLACDYILNSHPDLVILDLMLPGKDGFEICREVRPHYKGMILMLTARDEDIDQVVGLEIGADDYVVKPVEPRVLLARIRTLLRRNLPAQPEIKELIFGQLTINQSNQNVILNNQPIDFTSTEFQLLWFLACHAGEILSRDIILEQLRGIDYNGMDRSVDVGVSRLRKKLKDNTSKPARIKAIRGKGYLFVQDAWGG
jgi:DNA-binding response OmpR family regulator